MLHEFDPDEFPEIIVPEPEKRQTALGEVFFYQLPAEWGLDQSIAPNAGLSKDVLALTLSPAHTERLLRKTTPKFGGPLTNTDRPLAMALRFDWAGLVESLTPWIDYGVDTYFMMQQRQGDPDGAVADDENPAAKAIKTQIHMGLDFLKCYRGYSSATYVEGKTIVTHFESHYQDLE